MASIHRRPKSGYWHAAFRGPGGRLFLRSTKQRDRAKAMTVALEYERAAKLARRGELVEAQARKVLSDILEKAGSDVLHAPSTTEFLREWLAAKEASKSNATAERYTQVVKGFISHLGKRSKRPVLSITPHDVQGFLAARQKQGCSPSTVQLDGKILRTAFNRARRVGVISNNPADAVELPKCESVERGTFSPTELRLLADAAVGEWRTLILLGYFTGARLSDCCRLEWANVDLARGILEFKQAKTGKLLVVPIHTDLQAHLESLASVDVPGYIMPGMAAKGPGGRHGLSEGFKRIVRNAGLDLQTVQGGGKRQISRRTFHALRHSFTSALANAGVAPELRMKLTGHASDAIHRGYTHHELQTLRNALDKLPGLDGRL